MIEFLRANEDGTWGTVLAAVPEHIGTDTQALIDWAQVNLAVQAHYRHVVLWAVYSTEPEER